MKCNQSLSLSPFKKIREAFSSFPCEGSSNVIQKHLLTEGSKGTPVIQQVGSDGVPDTDLPLVLVKLFLIYTFVHQCLVSPDPTDTVVGFLHQHFVCSHLLPQTPGIILHIWDFPQATVTSLVGVGLFGHLQRTREKMVCSHHVGNMGRLCPVTECMLQ